MSSRQRKWQLKKLKQHLCGTCGKRKVFKDERCRICYAIYRHDKYKAYHAKKHLSNVS